MSVNSSKWPEPGAPVVDRDGKRGTVLRVVRCGAKEQGVRGYCCDVAVKTPDGWDDERTHYCGPEDFWSYWDEFSEALAETIDDVKARMWQEAVEARKKAEDDVSSRRFALELRHISPMYRDSIRFALGLGPDDNWVNLVRQDP